MPPTPVPPTTLTPLPPTAVSLTALPFTTLLALLMPILQGLTTGLVAGSWQDNLAKLALAILGSYATSVGHSKLFGAAPLPELPPEAPGGGWTTESVIAYAKMKALPDTRQHDALPPSPHQPMHDEPHLKGELLNMEGKPFVPKAPAPATATMPPPHAPAPAPNPGSPFAAPAPHPAPKPVMGGGLSEGHDA